MYILLLRINCFKLLFNKCVIFLSQLQFCDYLAIFTGIKLGRIGNNNNNV